MAYPVLVTADTEDGASAVSATTRTITLPSGLASGDLIVIIYHGTDAVGPSTTNITSNTGSWSVGKRGSLSGVANRYAAFFKWSDGTESGLTETISQSNGTNILLSAFSCYRITGADPSKTPFFEFLTGSTNSPSVTAPWGGGENLFFSVVSHAQAGPPTLTSYPTGYSNGSNYRDNATALIAQASKQSTAASDDAAAYSISYSGTRTFALSFVVGAGAPPAIDSINGGNPVKVGQTGVPIALSNFISTPTSVTCTYAGGAKSLTVSNITGNNTAITVDLEDRSEGVDYPSIGDALEFTVTDGVGTDSISTTIEEKTGEVVQTFEYVIDQYATYLAYHWDQDGFDAEGAEFVFTTGGFIPDDFDLREDSGFSSTGGGLVTGYLRPTVDKVGFTGRAGNSYYYEFTIDADGGIVVDDEPDALIFASVTEAELLSEHTSTTETVTGMSAGESSPFTVANGTYSKNGGSFISTAGTMENGDTFALRGTSDQYFGRTKIVSLTATNGNVVSTFRIVNKLDPTLSGSGGNGVIIGGFKLSGRKL